VAVRQDEAVEREVRIAARPETVFEFFTDPEKQVLWMGRRAELDARPGGIYRVEISDQIVGSGEFLEVEAPSRVVFSFGWEGQEAGQGEHGVPPGSRRVEVTLAPEGEGTLVRQTATFDAKGVLGRLYWYAVLPFHHFVFTGTLKGIERECTELIAGPNTCQLPGAHARGVARRESESKSGSAQ